MKNKKGFTLVELLAVIAILAILMLLIMPNVLKMFNEGKKDTFKTQIENIIRIAETQKQSDTMGGKTINLYCSGLGSQCTIDNKLSVNDTGIKYHVTFDYGVIAKSVAMEDSNYCYVNDTNITEINTSDFVEGGHLVCDSTSCSCQGATRYVYWSTTEGGSDTLYGPTSKPSGAKNSYTSLGLPEPAKLVRTTLDESNNAIKHEICLHYNNKLFCVDNNYWTTDADTTKTKLKADMESALGTTARTCSTNSSQTGISCFFGSAYCFIGQNNINNCHDGTSRCRITANGSAQCN